MGEHIASQHHRTMFKEIKKSQKEINSLYEQSWEAALKFKAMFNEITKTENETEALRQAYYEMLEAQLYSEEKRDEYFSLERTLCEIKDEFIAESQKLASRNSTYVAYSKKFSERLEEYVFEILGEVDCFYSSNKQLQNEKTELTKLSSKLGEEVATYKEKINILTKEKNELLSNKAVLEDTCSDYAERESNLRNQRDNLQATEERLCQDISNLKHSVQKLSSNIEDLKETCSNLSSQVAEYEKEQKLLNDDIIRRRKDQKRLKAEIEAFQKQTAELIAQRNNGIKKNRELTIEIDVCRATIEKVEEQRHLFKEAFKQIKKEKMQISLNCERAKKEKETLKGQYMEMQNERAVVGKQKDRLVSKEHRTKEVNQDLTSAHKYLIRELEDLKFSYRKSEERARKDIQVKQGLRDSIKKLHREMEEERRRMQKVTKDVKIQTDSDLACENRDIVILHAKLKTTQALRERDRALVERRNMDARALRCCSR
ncbi:unnamed protein product [Clavelina lepadiformis]|uniref:Uncharacterized protein n=2 Tax=Clavelina lepadiformis TaxID=159417 RepID=A0ABP0GXR0_CLALP